MERESESKSYMMLIFIGLAVISFLLRFSGLGSASLTMNEAENAVAALNLFDRVDSNGQLLYLLPTAVIFRFFGSSEFLARLFPAIMGVLLSLTPIMLRKKIGTRKAGIFAFLLSVDPVLLFWSKRADAAVPAIAFLALAAVFLIKRKNAASVFCFLAALSGGERAWPVIIILLVCAAAACFLDPDLLDILQWKFRKRDLLLPLFLFFMICLAFGFFPAGLNSFANGFVNSFRTAAAWTKPGLAAVIAAITLYSLLPLMICLYSSLRFGRIPALLISLAAALLLLFWHGIIMLPWISVLLWFGTLDFLTRLPEKLNGKKDFPFFMSAFVIAAAYSFFYFRLVELFSQRNGSDPVRITWNGTEQVLPLTRFGGTLLLTAVSILILALIVKILMGFVDSESIRRGMFCGLLVILSWILINGIWNAGGFDREGDLPLKAHQKNTASVLNGAYTSYTSPSFFELLTDAEKKHGDKVNTPYGLNFISGDAMIEWMLRSFPGIITTGNIQTDRTGIDLIISRSDMPLEPSGYVHTQQNWRGTMDWRQFSLRDWGRWLIFGDAAGVEEPPISLWVRADYIIFYE